MCPRNRSPSRGHLSSVSHFAQINSRVLIFLFSRLFLRDLKKHLIGSINSADLVFFFFPPAIEIKNSWQDLRGLIPRKLNRSSVCINDRFCFSEIEAQEACKWLRAAGFPQYAQMYEGKITFDYFHECIGLSQSNAPWFTKIFEPKRNFSRVMQGVNEPRDNLRNIRHTSDLVTRSKNKEPPVWVPHVVVVVSKLFKRRDTNIFRRVAAKSAYLADFQNPLVQCRSFT